MPWAEVEIHGVRGRLEWEAPNKWSDLTEPGLLAAVRVFAKGAERGSRFALTPDGPTYAKERWTDDGECFLAAVVETVGFFGGVLYGSDIGEYLGDDAMDGQLTPEHPEVVAGQTLS